MRAAILAAREHYYDFTRFYTLHIHFIMCLLQLRKLLLFEIQIHCEDIKSMKRMSIIEREKEIDIRNQRGGDLMNAYYFVGFFS